MTRSQNKRLRNRRLLSSNRYQSAQTPAERENSVACTVCDLRNVARDAVGLQYLLMKRSAHLAGFAVLLVIAAAPAFGAAAASVSGVVRDSAGEPQIGAEVQLLRSNLSLVASVYTDDSGRFAISSLVPGTYALKAMGPYFPAFDQRRCQGSGRGCRQSHSEYSLRSHPMASGTAAFSPMAKG